MRILGLDAGVASVGWALLEIENENFERPAQGRIVAAGVWMFDPAEERTRNGSQPKSVVRRAQRSQRRTLRRRRQRMNEVRRLLHRHGLLPAADRHALRLPGLDPWQLRARALGQALSPLEFAVALGHIARRRGFKSHLRPAAARGAEEGSKLIQALEETRAKLERFETPARLFCEDESFRLPGSAARRLRNRPGDYSRLQHRDDLAREVGAIFRAQRRLAAPHATRELETEFARAALSQRPLGDRFADLGPCPFEPDQRRASKHAYSFELFRLLARLAHMQIVEGGAPRRLTAAQIDLAAADFGQSAKFTYAELRRRLALSEETVFPGVAREAECEIDIVARDGAAVGAHALRREICAAADDAAWRALLLRPERLDDIAEALAFRRSMEARRAALARCGLPQELIEELLRAGARGVWDGFMGAAHVSAKAARRLIPHLGRGLAYPQACHAAGYDPESSRERRAFDVGAHGKEALRRILTQQRISEDLVASPTARKALIEAIKQVKAIVERFGAPDRIHVEMAREIGKSAEARRALERAAQRREAEAARLRRLFQETFGRAPHPGDAGAEDLLRFELWREQKGVCLYTGAPIDVAQILDHRDSVQVDHVLPRGRFGDDSFANKVLCLAAANRAKRDRTPAEWFAKEKPAQAWRDFVARVEALDLKRAKRRNLLLEAVEAAASKFDARNLSDTRRVCRLLSEALQQIYPESGARHVFARPGALTARLRRAYGLQLAKTTADGARRADDRHHALDAIIVAATTEATLQRATRAIQRADRYARGAHLGLPPPPWPGFRDDALRTLERVFVARSERRRARGKAHDATLLHVATRGDKPIVYERKTIADLKLADVDRIKDLDRNGALAASLRAWFEAGKPMDTPPRGPNGGAIRRIRLATSERVNLSISTGDPGRRASANRSEMARIDVFRKRGRDGAWRHHFTPIYRHEIVAKAPPTKIMRSGDESLWPTIDESYEFLWSLHPMSLVELTKPDGETIRGYFRNLDRSTGALTLCDIADARVLRRGIGARKLLRFRKLQVDRLGVFSVVEREPRLWRGRVWSNEAMGEPETARDSSRGDERK
jgi:CRISPR-associated endonuclease Csn1